MFNLENYFKEALGDYGTPVTTTFEKSNSISRAWHHHCNFKSITIFSLTGKNAVETMNSKLIKKKKRQNDEDVRHARKNYSFSVSPVKKE